MDKRTCTLDDCGAPYYSRGMCKPHYRKDYYRRNKSREKATNKAYLAERPEYRRDQYRRLNAEAIAARTEALATSLAASHKECTRCREYLPKVEFYADPRRRDGHFSWCKRCFTSHCREARDPEADARRGAAYRATPEGSAKSRERQRKWYADNPERAREQTRRYQARKMAATIGPVDYVAILERDGMQCHLCGTEIPSLTVLHFDHVVPLSKDGPHSMDNIKPSHATCNLRKGARIAA